MVLSTSIATPPWVLPMLAWRGGIELHTLYSITPSKINVLTSVNLTLTKESRQTILGYNTQRTTLIQVGTCSGQDNFLSVIRHA